MRLFLFVLLLAVLGAGLAWWRGCLHIGFLARGGSSGQGGSSTAGSPSGPDFSDKAELSPKAKELYDQAEARWKQVADAGKKPVEDPQAPALCRDYSAVLRDTWNKPGLKAFQETLIQERLAPLGDTLFFSSRRYDGDETGLFTSHQVRSGDTPDKIGREYNLSSQFVNILRGRKADDGQMAIGENLKVVRLSGREQRIEDERGFFLHVDKSDFCLDLLVGGLFMRRYPVAIGAPTTETPVGRAKIDMREMHPTWTVPGTNERLPWNHPKNILGKVWIRLDAEGIKKPGIGIHGFNGDPSQAVGVKASNGCVRMRNEQAEELYNVLSPCGTYPKDGFISRATMIVEIVE